MRSQYPPVFLFKEPSLYFSPLLETVFGFINSKNAVFLYLFWEIGVSYALAAWWLNKIKVSRVTWVIGCRWWLWLATGFGCNKGEDAWDRADSLSCLEYSRSWAFLLYPLVLQSWWRWRCWWWWWWCWGWRLFDNILLLDLGLSTYTATQTPFCLPNVAYRNCSAKHDQKILIATSQRIRFMMKK